MNIEIFNTGYDWNWLRSLNQFLDGFSWGTGLVFALLLCVLIIRVFGKKKNDNQD